MAIGGNRDSGSAMSEINVTPFVDVMLVLLIIFMMVAPHLESGIDVSLPKADAEQVIVDDDEVIISITKAGSIYVGNEAVPMERLPAVLAEQVRLKQKNEVYLKADEDVKYGLVAQVMAQIKAAGISGLGIITEPPSKKAVD